MLCSIGMHYSDHGRVNIEFYSKPSLSSKVQNILLVEDQIETGKSLKKAEEFFKQEGKSIITCSLFSWEDAEYMPTYYFSKTKLKGEVIFPWEKRSL